VPVIAGDQSVTRLNEVNGYVETARYAGMTAGPLIGGGLAAAGGTAVAMLVNAATFAVVALAALLLRARRRPSPAVDEGAPPERARDGIVFLFRDRLLAIVVGASFVSLLFFSASITAEVFFLKDDLHVHDLVYGVLFSAWTLGMVVGAVLVSRRIPARALAAGALVAIAVQGVGLGLPTIWLLAWLVGILWFIGGVGHGTKNVLVRTLIQERVPERTHGRAFAAYNGLRNGAELVALASGGLLVAAIGGRTTLGLAGAVPVLVALAGLVLYRRRVRREPAVPDNVPAQAPQQEPAPVPAPGVAE